MADDRPRSELAAFIVAIRGNRTQKEIATAIGVKPSAVSNWENDVSRPDDTTLAALLHACGYGPDSPEWIQARDLVAPAFAAHDGDPVGVE